MPASNLYVYPDVVVVYGTPQFEDSDLDTLLNPAVLRCGRFCLTIHE
jgi:hypothetical protein